ncbi:MAG TPA: GGDEF domain-containing protein [Geobacteraceae bacterium]|nr:GGDEF domain-containing protein [Geobacteraceae bacterium]
MNSVHELISASVRLPSPPAIAIRILDAVRRDDFSFKDIARIIESDPALVAKVLKVANSSYYNFARRVSNIETAISVLGTHAVKNIALSFVICADMKSMEDKGFDFDHYWRRAITAAVAADLAASLVGLRSRDIFVTALLQDIGVIVFNASFPERYRLTMNENLAGQAPLHEIERHCFGFDHQELGAELLSSWRLPEEIYIPIRYHHRHDLIPDEYREQVEILKLSDSLSAIYHGNRSVDEIGTVRKILHTAFDIRGEAVDRLIDDVAAKTLEILVSFDIPAGAMQPFSAILQQANEELSNLNTSYELLVIELRQAKQKAEKLAEELHCANVKLHELAFRDALTGLYNHRYFQEALDRELDRSKRYQRDLSLIIFDIDYFKKINDTYGHPAGDRVLAAISRRAESAVRSSDIIARYGGEEFAVILPETDFSGAGVFAERLRSEIERLEIEVEGKKIKATVSAGFTSYRPGARVPEKGAIIGMADKALYIAKQSGRNRVQPMRFAGA